MKMLILYLKASRISQTEGIIGKPVTQGDKTFLPVVSITLGYGGGNATMKGSGTGSTASGAGSGTGALGLGAKLCTDAIIVLDGQNVFMLPVNSTAAGGSLVDKIPQIISGMKSGATAGSGTSASGTGTNNTGTTGTGNSNTSAQQNGSTKQTQNTTKY